MQQIAAAIQEGAKAYMDRQYLTISVVGAVLFFWGILRPFAAGSGFFLGDPGGRKLASRGRSRDFTRPLPCCAHGNGYSCQCHKHDQRRDRSSNA